MKSGDAKIHVILWVNLGVLVCRGDGIPGETKSGNVEDECDYFA